jgi:hypothetical protein
VAPSRGEHDGAADGNHTLVRRGATPISYLDTLFGIGIGIGIGIGPIPSQDSLF